MYEDYQPSLFWARSKLATSLWAYMGGSSVDRVGSNPLPVIGTPAVSSDYHGRSWIMDSTLFSGNCALGNAGISLGTDDFTVMFRAVWDADQTIPPATEYTRVPFALSFGAARMVLSTRVEESAGVSYDLIWNSGDSAFMFDIFDNVPYMYVCVKRRGSEIWVYTSVSGQGIRESLIDSEFSGSCTLYGFGGSQAVEASDPGYPWSNYGADRFSMDIRMDSITLLPYALNRDELGRYWDLLEMAGSETNQYVYPVNNSAAVLTTATTAGYDTELVLDNPTAFPILGQNERTCATLVNPSDDSDFEIVEVYYNQASSLFVVSTEANWPIGTLVRGRLLSDFLTKPRLKASYSTLSNYSGGGGAGGDLLMGDGNSAGAATGYTGYGHSLVLNGTTNSTAVGADVQISNASQSVGVGYNVWANNATEAVVMGRQLALNGATEPAAFGNELESNGTLRPTLFGRQLKALSANDAILMGTGIEVYGHNMSVLGRNFKGFSSSDLNVFASNMTVYGLSKVSLLGRPFAVPAYNNTVFDPGATNLDKSPTVENTLVAGLIQLSSDGSPAATPGMEVEFPVPAGMKLLVREVGIAVISGGFGGGYTPPSISVTSGASAGDIMPSTVVNGLAANGDAKFLPVATTKMVGNIKVVLDTPATQSSVQVLVLLKCLLIAASF